MGTIDLEISGGQHGRIADIKAEYARMLSPLINQLGDTKNGLTSMPLMKGSKFTGNCYAGKPFRLLFVGRAVNGWEIEFKKDSIEAVVDQVFDSAIDTGYISKGKVFDKNEKEIYNYNKSPFFQLCHAVLNQYGIDDNWSEHMAWTNLYKVAPYKSGNPSNKLIRETLNSCARILRKEISYLRPTHIIFITGDWWYKPIGKGLNEYAFVDEIGVDLYEDAKQVIIGSGISDAFHFHPKIVITQRPESAKISRTEHAKAIFDAFADIEKGEQN